MKKLMITLAAAAALALPALADVVYYFQSVGPDRYADGTTLKDGEFYAFVWSPSTFAGFNADGSLKSTNDVLLAAVPFAKGGKLACTSHQVTDSEAAAFVGGSFSVVALDTRKADGTLSSTDASARTLSVVNNYSTTATMSYTAVCATSSLNVKAPIAVNVQSFIPADAPQPVITGMTMREGANGREMVLTVKGTAAYLRYTAVSAATVADLDSSSAGRAVAPATAATAANGATTADDTIEIVVPATGNSGFFKVTRQ